MPRPDVASPPSPRARRLPKSAVAAAALGLLAAAALAAALAGGGVGVERVGGDAAVNAGAGDPVDIAAHNSPSLARDPTDASTVAVANRIDSPQFGCGLHVSRDGGASWAHPDVPLPAGEDTCFAPDVAFDAAGTLYVSYVTLAGLGNTPNAVWLASSDDAGATFSAPTRIGGPRSFQVSLRAHPREPGRLYLTWLAAESVGTLSFPQPGQPLMAATSADGGDSWSRPVRLNDPAHRRAIAPSPVVAADGTWYVAYLALGDDRLNYHGAHEGQGGPPPQGPWRLIMARSGDGGASWTQTVVDQLVPTERFLVFMPPFPQPAVDGDTVYVAFHGGRANADGAARAADVWLWASPDGGASWPAPTRVNHTPRGDATRQALPQIAVAPTGRLDVVYYDRRADADNVLTEASLQSSFDGGATFTDRVVLSSQAFDSRIGFGSFRDLPELGSRLALSSTEAGALAVWADTRAGTQASGKQDLHRARVAVDGGLGAAAAAAGVGGGAAVVAIAVGLAARRRASGSR